jgi:hypothetical protein
MRSNSPELDVLRLILSPRLLGTDLLPSGTDLSYKRPYSALIFVCLELCFTPTHFAAILAEVLCFCATNLQDYICITPFHVCRNGGL